MACSEGKTVAITLGVLASCCLEGQELPNISQHSLMFSIPALSHFHLTGFSEVCRGFVNNRLARALRRKSLAFQPSGAAHTHRLPRLRSVPSSSLQNPTAKVLSTGYTGVM